MSVTEYPEVLDLRPARRRWWVRAFQLCLALTAAAGAIAIGALTGFRHSSGTTGTGTPSPALAGPTPGITLMSTPSGSGAFDLAGTFMASFGNTDYLYVGTPLGKPTSNVTVVSGRPGHWDFAGAHDALPNLPAWAIPNTGELRGGVVWDPEVFKFGSTYVMYFAPGVYHQVPLSHCIGVAQSNSPSGPFIPAPTPITCQLAQGGSIDAQVFVDRSGPNGPQNPYYLIWKSENNNLPVSTGNKPTSFWVQGLSNDGMSLTGSGTQAPWQIFWADEPWQQGLVEAPQLAHGPDGTIYLFYSGGACFCSAQYGMGVARCTSIIGPCTDLSSTPLITSNAQGEGPGEESVYQGRDGSLWLLYNPWFAGDGSRGYYRPLEAARIRFGRDGPYVAKAGTFPNP